MLSISLMIEVLLHNFIQLPQLYLLESQSDLKDINRIKTVFNASAKSLGVVNYDNAVWDATHHYINDRNTDYIEDNFVLDTFKSLNINGLYIYDNDGNKIWGMAYNYENWQEMPFLPFEKPSRKVIEHILNPAQNYVDNSQKPITHAGLILLDNQLILFASTRVIKASLQGNSNGTMVFWRIISDDALAGLQQQAGIEFDITLIDIENATENLNSKGSYQSSSYRTEKGIIYDTLPLKGRTHELQFSYKAPKRLFDAHWFNQTMIVTALIFAFTSYTVLMLVHIIIVRPLLRATNLVNAVIEKQDLTVRFNSNRKDELGGLFNLIDRLLSDVSSKEQELISHNKRLQKISKTDGLTNIANRRAFDIYMKQLLTNHHLYANISLLVCDVDFFKKYNDFYGHDKGDKALRLIADCLRRNLHEETDFVARYGGEEFVIVLKDTNADQALSVGNNLITQVNALHIIHEHSDVSDYVTVSIGIYSFDIQVEHDYTSLFEKADQALYQAKSDGRNRARLF